MSESTRAIFLSYASQDAEAARRICDALCAAGLAVWLDQSELRGGDAWHASIRRKIRECALFVPIISANTQAREEGYFRREWKLAVNRTLDMADDKAFLLPVVIDATSDANARVPEKFRELQWTRLPAGETPATFAQRVARLMSGAAARAPLIAPTTPPQASPAGVSAAASGVGAPPSIAVLPFDNRSRDEVDEYFADGLAGELLDMLAKIRGLRVAARTSSFQFEGKSKSEDRAVIGRKLNVATVLEASVRKSGNRMRIGVQRVNVSDGCHPWSETCDRTLEDIFAVHELVLQYRGPGASMRSWLQVDVHVQARRLHEAEPRIEACRGVTVGVQVCKRDSLGKSPLKEPGRERAADPPPPRALKHSDAEDARAESRTIVGADRRGHPDGFSVELGECNDEALRADVRRNPGKTLFDGVTKGRCVDRGNRVDVGRSRNADVDSRRRSGRPEPVRQEPHASLAE